MPMTPAELDRAQAQWPDLTPSRWGSTFRGWTPGETLDDIVRHAEARDAEVQRLLALRGRARYTQGGWDLEHKILIGDASAGLGGIWLCHGDPTWWDPHWTRNLTGFEPLDDPAREVLAFVAFCIERDHHLGDRAEVAESLMPPPRDAHLRYLQEFLAQRRTRETAGVAFDRDPMTREAP